MRILKKPWFACAIIAITAMIALPTFATIASDTGYTQLENALPNADAIIAAQNETAATPLDLAGLAGHDITRGSDASAHANIGPGCSEATLIPSIDTVAVYSNPSGLAFAGNQKLTAAYQNPSGIAETVTLAATTFSSSFATHRPPYDTFLS